MLGDFTQVVDGKRVALESLKNEFFSEDYIFDLQFTLFKELNFIFVGEGSGLSTYRHAVDSSLEIFYEYENTFAFKYKDSFLRIELKNGICVYDGVETFLSSIRSVWAKGKDSH